MERCNAESSVIFHQKKKKLLQVFEVSFDLDSDTI